jgi:hypothetical protein
MTANKLIDLFRRVEPENWCTNYGCTTCGAMPFRTALRELRDTGNPDLVTSLIELPLDELQQFPFWDDALRIAMLEADPMKHRKAILSAWTSKIRSNPRVADVVLYYVLRQPMSGFVFGVDEKEEWIKACAAVAVETGDASLVESLVAVLGNRISNYEGLVEMARALTSNRLIRNTLAKS